MSAQEKTERVRTGLHAAAKVSALTGGLLTLLLFGGCMLLVCVAAVS